MSSIPQNCSDEKALVDCVQRFLSIHHVGKLLARCNGLKEKGVSPISLLRYKLSNIFVGRSMYMQQRTGSFKEGFSKNTFYRFLNSTKTNVFIIDDSLFDRSSCKKTELGSKVFDHTDMHFKKGFRMLTLSWSDGNTLIPVNNCLLASAKDTNIIGPVKNFDNRTLAGKRRKIPGFPTRHRSQPFKQKAWIANIYVRSLCTIFKNNAKKSLNPSIINGYSDFCVYLAVLEVLLIRIMVAATSITTPMSIVTISHLHSRWFF